MYYFVNKDGNSSVYTALSNLLQDTSYWKQAHTPDAYKFHLIFGERNRLKFARLGHEPGYEHLVNYYRGSSILCRKAALKRTLLSYCRQEGLDSLKWLPETYVVYPSATLSDKSSGWTSLHESKAAARAQKDERKQLENVFTTERHKTWIAKSSNGAKGEGIFLSRDYDEILSKIDTQTNLYVIQEYIEDPLLLPKNRKFDIRCWVLLDHNYQIHLFREGVLRTSSEPYIAADISLSHLVCHITNHSLQKTMSPNYGRYEEGNEMFFDDFDRFLQDHYNVTIQDTLLPQMKDIICTCFQAVKEQIHTNNLPYRSFQLFVFDFLTDNQLNVWLIEVNGAPACAQKLLPSLVKSLKLTAIDPVFQPPKHDTCEEDNLFEKIVLS